MIKICFVCHGNICRSPMAEFIFKKIVSINNCKNDYYIESRATHTDEIFRGVGSHIYPPAQRVMTRRKIPFDSEKMAELLKESDYDCFDLFVCMDNENVRSMLRIFSNDKNYKIRKLSEFSDTGRDVSDPWYTGDFDTAFSDIYKGCEGLFEYTQSNKNT